MTFIELDAVNGWRLQGRVENVKWKMENEWGGRLKAESIKPFPSLKPNA